MDCFEVSSYCRLNAASYRPDVVVIEPDQHRPASKIAIGATIRRCYHAILHALRLLYAKKRSHDVGKRVEAFTVWRHVYRYDTGL